MKKEPNILNNRNITTSIIDELYGAIITLYIQSKLTLEEQKYFNKMLGIYMFKKYMGKPKLELVLEKCKYGDLITYFGSINLEILNINEKCKIFHKLCNDLLMMLFLLINMKLVHFDVKIDNILVDEKDGIIQYKLSDNSMVRKYNMEIKSKLGTNSYISPLLLLELKYKIAIAKYLYDWYSMALTLFNIFLFLFPSNVNTSQYFPFINDESTFNLKIDIWSSKIKYESQVRLLQSSLRYSFQKILQIPGLTENNKTNLEKDITIMLILFLSNNPFPNRGQDIQAETIEKIKEYLKENGLIHPTN